jgi:hypothetical protein
MKWQLRLLLVTSLVVCTQLGCKHFGPRSIVADRIPYNEAIALSWKEQTLLNIVKMRYGDTPFFIDVPQITSGYTIQSGATATAGIFPPVNPIASFAQQLGANFNLQAAYQDRPTVSYMPQTGSQFIRNLTTPMNPGTVMFMLQSGYPADVVFNLTVDSINGVNNRSALGGELRAATPEFTRVVNLIRKAQMTGHIGIRVTRDKEHKDSVAFFFHDHNIDPEIRAALAEVRKTLQLAPDRSEFRITFGSLAANPNEIAIRTRSVINVLQVLSTYVDVPVEHLARGIAPELEEPENGANALIRVQSGSKKPCDPFIAVYYERQWFWIEKSDTPSKRTISNLLVLLALSDTGTKENLPVITIQAN